jgi:hypothetical protein
VHNEQVKSTPVELAEEMFQYDFKELEGYASDYGICNLLASAHLVMVKISIFKIWVPVSKLLIPTVG